ncbi:hypothetical protein [Xenococcus sp. PCC 7305]|uniref:hypothetical protein n=1 Tax=Xenococcus sp. PCC 7305 TaxID=102125 RepID=UPI0008FBE89F|nr:hypothetical protein [Xenococcus sp. PCC 7305]
MYGKKHPNKEIRAALEDAEQKGWRILQGGSHAWGKIYCPYNNSDCRCGEFCKTSIWSTPKNPTHHARQIRRVVDNCIYQNR